MKKSVLVTRRIPAAGLERLRAAGLDIEILSADQDRAPAHDDVVRAAREHDVLLTLLTERVDRAVLTANPGLLGVAQMAVGYDNIDVTAAEELGIPVANTPGVLTAATADLTFALLLSCARRIVESHAYTLAGRFRTWGPELFCGASVGPGPDGTRRTLGIVGYGRIGQAVARRARGFDMEVLVHTRRPESVADPDVRVVELDELLERADFVTLHVPLTDGTRHLIDAAALRRMKSTAILVNTARGPVVDEAALVAALRSNEIGGAGLDVYEREPELARGLTEAPNVVLLPHIGSATHETRDRMAVMAADAAIAFANGGTPEHLVTPAGRG